MKCKPQMRDGEPLAVLRPKNKAFIELMAAAIASRESDAVHRLMNSDDEKKDLRLAGWLSEDGKLIDEKGKICGELMPGDHFSTLTKTN